MIGYDARISQDWWMRAMLSEIAVSVWEEVGETIVVPSVKPTLSGYRFCTIMFQILAIII